MVAVNELVVTCLCKQVPIQLAMLVFNLHIVPFQCLLCAYRRARLFILTSCLFSNDVQGAFPGEVLVTLTLRSRYFSGVHEQTKERTEDSGEYARTN